MTPGPWTQETRLRWFYGALAASAASVAWLFWPFVDVIVFAGVVAAVSAPIHVQLLGWFGGRRLLAACSTTLLFAVLVLLPLAVVLYRFAVEGVEFARVGVEWVARGGLDAALAEVEQWAAAPVLHGMAIVLPEGSEPKDLILEPLRQSLLSTVGFAGTLLPRLVESLAAGIVDAVLFVFTVITLLAEGPRLMRFVFDVSPLDERYERQLLAVFREFANNMVVGALVVAVLQGAVATIGYILVGVPRALFLGVLTGLASFVPMIGTGIVAVPVSLYVGWLYGWGWGVALVLWSAAVVGTVDNVVRPLMLRGSSDIHPLLIFFAVFGGMSWMGISGVLIGPVLVAFFLALATIHRDELSQPTAPGGDQPSS